MSNFLLSFELLYLMGWLLKNEKQQMRTLIQQALNNGLAIELDKIDGVGNAQANEVFQNTFLDFITYLEDVLIDGLEETETSQKVRENLLLSLKKLNINNVDTKTLLAGLKQAEQEMTANPKQTNTKTVLLKKILNNWDAGTQEIN